MSKVKGEPILSSEKIANSDGTPSDYFVRYLRKAFSDGEKTITFPVTSVNGKTGDVILNLQEIINEGGSIDYDKLNEKIQELIYGLDQIRNEVNNKFLQHEADYHKYSFQGFTTKDFGDDRYFSESYSENSLAISSISGLTITTTVKHGLVIGDRVTLKGLSFTNDATRKNDGEYNVSAVGSTTKFSIAAWLDLLPPIPTASTARVIVSGTKKHSPNLYIPGRMYASPYYTQSSPYIGGYHVPPAGLAGANERLFTSFSVFAIERTMRVNRIAIPINMFVNGNNPVTASNYSMHQFGIFSAKKMKCIRKSTGQRYFTDVYCRWPASLLWSSPQLDGRNGYLVDGGWTDGMFEDDINRESAGAGDKYRIIVGVNTQPFWVLHYDCDIVLRRGVYFIGRSSMLFGARSSSTYVDFDKLGFATTAPESYVYSMNGGASLDSNYSLNIAGFNSVGAGIANNTVTGTTYPYSSGSVYVSYPRDFDLYGLKMGFRGMSIYDMTSRPSFPNMNSELYYQDLIDNRISPIIDDSVLYRLGTDNSFYSVTSGINQGLSIDTPCQACIGLAGTIEDGMPTDTW